MSKHKFLKTISKLMDILLTTQFVIFILWWFNQLDWPFWVTLLPGLALAVLFGLGTLVYKIEP